MGSVGGVHLRVERIGCYTWHLVKIEVMPSGLKSATYTNVYVLKLYENIY